MNLAIWMTVGAACLLSCYFAACNIALKTFSRKRLADLFEERGRADRLEPLLARLSNLLLLTGVLRTCFGLIVLLGTLYYIQTQMQEQGGLLSYVLAFGIAVALMSIFSVAIPISWARYHREGLLVWSSPILAALAATMFPIASLLHLFDPVIRRLSGADLAQGDDNPLSDHVLTMVEDHEGGSTVDEAQKEMLEAVFELPSTTAGEIMTPRTDVKGIEVNSTLEQVKQAILEFGHSRIPVYEDNMDHVVGMLYAKDMIRFVGDGEHFNLREVLREAFMVPESKSVRELLAEFKGKKVHLAIVLDEYGGTAGLVTIEDIIEEIIGDIQDEYELREEPPQIAPIDEKTAEVDARTRIDDLNDELSVELPEDEDYDTVGGFVFATLGHIPEAGEAFNFANLRFTVLEAERTKVRRVRVERLEPQTSPLSGQGEAS